jgi:ABC-type nitrate/sulfonate/bicarbonate transport system substrate-binding protein
MKKMIMKRSLLILLSLFLVVAFSACGEKETDDAAGGGTADSGGTGSSASAEVERILVKLPSITSGGPALVARELGFFDEQGLDIEEVGAVPGGNQIQSVITGDIDFTLGNHTDREIEALDKGIDVKVVLAQSETTEDMPHMRWMVPDDSGINGPEDLKGKRIASTYTTGGCPITNLRAYLKTGGLTLDDVELVQMDDNLQGAALEQGQVDVITVHAPLSGILRQQLGLRTLFSDFDVFGGLAGNNIATSQEVIDTNPEKVRRFLAAYIKAQVWIDDHQDEASALYAEVLDLDPELAAIYDRTYFSRDGLEYDERIQIWIDDLVALGEIEEGQFVPSDIYTNEFNPNYKA